MADPFGKYDVYSVASSIYCYPDSSVLKNKLDIRDPVLLRKVEADLSTARQAEIFHTPVVGRFTARTFAISIASCWETSTLLPGISAGKTSPKAQQGL